MPEILLIEDDDDLNKVLKEALELHGHRVTTALEGELALNEIDQNRFDVAIVDIFLPNMDGIDVIKQLLSKCPGVKVVAVSGGSKIDKEMCLAAAMESGAHATLPKPFTPTQLLEAIQQVARTA